MPLLRQFGARSVQVLHQFPADTGDTLVEAFGTELAKRGEVEIGHRRFDLGADPFRRTLPAQLVIQICRHVYVYWVRRRFRQFGGRAAGRLRDDRWVTGAPG